MTSGSLWNCYRDEMDNVNYNASYGTPFKYKIKNNRKNRSKIYTNEGDVDRPAGPLVPTLNVKSLFHPNISVISGDH